MDAVDLPITATVAKRAGRTDSLFLRLNPPINGFEFAVVSEEAKGASSFWSAVGTGNPVGREVTILKMRVLGDAYEVEEIAPTEQPDFSSLCEVKDP